MKELKEAPACMLKFEGTPAEIGGQIFERMCMPAIRKTSNVAQPQALAQMYIGFMSAAMGSMVADFGMETTVSAAQFVVDSIEKMDDEIASVRVQ